MSITYEKGAYRVRIIDQQMSESNNGNPQLVFTLQPLAVYSGDMLQACTEPRSGGEPRVFLTLTDKTVDWISATLAAIGYKGSSFSALDPASAMHQSMIGTECDAFCDHQEWNGQDQEKWNLSRGRQTLKPVQAKQLRELDAKFGKTLKSAVQNAGTPPAVTLPTRPAALDPDPSIQGQEDPIPF